MQYFGYEDASIAKKAETDKAITIMMLTVGGIILLLAILCCKTIRIAV